MPRNFNEFQHTIILHQKLHRLVVLNYFEKTCRLFTCDFYTDRAATFQTLAVTSKLARRSGENSPAWVSCVPKRGYVVTGPDGETLKATKCLTAVLSMKTCFLIKMVQVLD